MSASNRKYLDIIAFLWVCNASHYWTSEMRAKSSCLIRSKIVNSLERVNKYWKADAPLIDNQNRKKKSIDGLMIMNIKKANWTRKLAVSASILLRQFNLFPFETFPGQASTAAARWFLSADRLVTTVREEAVVPDAAWKGASYAKSRFLWKIINYTSLIVSKYSARIINQSISISKWGPDFTDNSVSSNNICQVIKFSVTF